MHYDTLKNLAQQAPFAKLKIVREDVIRSWGRGLISDQAYEELDALIQKRLDRHQQYQAQQALPGVAAAAQARPHHRTGSRPRTERSLPRRRAWAGSRLLPLEISTRFTTGELAVLNVIADEVVKSGSCTWPIGKIAAVAGVCETLVRKTLRLARQLELVHVQHRKVAGWRNDTNVVTIVHEGWQKWLKQSYQALRRGGCTFVQPTTKSISIQRYKVSKRGATELSDVVQTAIFRSRQGYRGWS